MVFLCHVKRVFLFWLVFSLFRDIFLLLWVSLNEVLVSEQTAHLFKANFTWVYSKRYRQLLLQGSQELGVELLWIHDAFKLLEIVLIEFVWANFIVIVFVLLTLVCVMLLLFQSLFLPFLSPVNSVLRFSFLGCIFLGVVPQFFWLGVPQSLALLVWIH